MTTPADQPPALADRIAAALRTAAYHCDGTCGLNERECDAQHPIQVAVLHHDQVATVYGDIPNLAAVAAGVVQPELDARDAEIALLRSVAQSAAVLLRAAADRHPADAGTYRAAARALDDTAMAGQQATPCADCGLPHAADGWPAEVCRRVRAYGGVYADSKPDPAAPDCGCQTDAHPGHYPTCPTTATTGA